MKKNCLLFFVIALVIFNFSCRKKSTRIFSPTPYTFFIPLGFPNVQLPSDNPLTEEGIELGRHLFYNKNLSKDQTISCGSCHEMGKGFTDGKPISTGINNALGTRSAMPLFNLAWVKHFMWDGRANSIYNQIFLPISSHIEMDIDTSNFDLVINRLKADPEMLDLFFYTFGNEEITLDKIFKAIVQFELSLVSANSKYDKVKRGEAQFSVNEYLGYQVFINIKDSLGSGDCQHCHFDGLFSSNDFRNNGLDVNFTDKGYGAVVNDSNQNYKFRVPSLRNLAFTAPYMHDGRFQNIDQVIQFYNSDFHYNSKNLDANMLRPKNLMSPTNVAELKAFLNTLNDSAFISNPKYSDPYK